MAHRRRGVSSLLALTALLAGAGARAAAAETWTPSGDIGAGAVAVQGTAPGQRTRTSAIPYAYADLGPFFARVDTFGIKLLPLGWGALELAARVSSEGADNAGPGVASRRNPRPIGIGTFQETPWGGVFLDAFGDPVSGGSLLEGSYAAELDAGRLSIYPQAGVTWRSARYVDHLYGVSAAQAPAAGEPRYSARASTVPWLALSAEVMVTPRWAVVGNVQVEALDAAITDSPRVGRSSRTTWLLSLARHFD